MGKSVWDYIAPALGGAAGVALAPFTAGTSLAFGPALGGALGAGVGSGLSTGIETGSPLKGLAAGAASGLGSYAGGQLLGPSLSGLGGTTNAASGAAEPGFLGTDLGKALGSPSLAGQDIFGGQTLGNLAGGALGSKVATGAAQAASPGIFSPSISTDVPGYKPSQQSAMGLPGSLSSYSGLNPNQQASNIATRGVYGQGNGPDENSYFLNLINRSLVDPSGKVAGDTSGINPVENSYLSQLGLGGYSNSTDLLQKIGNYAA